MKKILVSFFLTVTLLLGLSDYAIATDLVCHNCQPSQQKTTFLKRDVAKVIKKQIKCAKKYDLNTLSTLYSEDFVSSDGFDKNIYFKLIKDTWATYPGIKYDTKIKDISFQDDVAIVSVYETSVAEVSEVEDGVKIFGELTSFSNGKYYLKKYGEKWLFTKEQIDDEKSILKFGDTRFVQMDLNSPKNVKAGEYYTATLNIDAPKDSLFIASICRDKITYPQEKSEEVFRKLPESNILERMFISNKDSKNEYNIASVGMTKSILNSDNQIKFYMAGIAFLMTRVNVGADNAR